MEQLILLGGIIIALCVYFLPSFVALQKEHSNTGPLFVFNLLLGWTGLCWLIALVWAYSDTARIRTEDKVLDTMKLARGINCPHCSEIVARNAMYCDYCGESIHPKVANL